METGLSGKLNFQYKISVRRREIKHGGKNVNFDLICRENPPWLTFHITPTLISLIQQISFTPIKIYIACFVTCKIRANMRSSPSFFKIGVLKNSVILTGKHLCWWFVLIKVHVFRQVALLKTDSITGFFQWILQNFCKQLFYRIFPVAAFVI